MPFGAALGVKTRKIGRLRERRAGRAKARYSNNDKIFDEGVEKEPNERGRALSGERETAATVEIEARDGALLLAVKAQPGARKNELRGVQDGALKVCVTQVAEKGKANKAIAEFLAKSLKLRKSQIELASGELASQKKFRVVEIDEAALRERIEAALAAQK